MTIIIIDAFAAHLHAIMSECWLNCCLTPEFCDSHRSYGAMNPVRHMTE
jgi:hypothetical protein